VNEGGEPQVSWKAIEEKAQVFSSEGRAVGKVASVVGDADADVFTGLAVSLSLLSADRFVESERVRAIWPDRVDLTITSAEVEELPEYEEQQAVRLRPGEGSWFSRLFRRG
jgi:hypothetical protein